MAGGAAEKTDDFPRGRASAAAVAREVADVLAAEGYNVIVRDYDLPIGVSFIEKMHEAIENGIVVLYSREPEDQPATRAVSTRVEARQAQSQRRPIVILRCEDKSLRELFAGDVYQDLAGITDPADRRHFIIAAAHGVSQAAAPRPFIGVPPRIVAFAGRAQELDRLDAILFQGSVAAATQAFGRAAVQGPGGVGKTALAVEYAHRFRHLHGGVWWCPAATRVGVMTSLAALAVTLRIVPADEADLEKAATLALRRLAEESATWLLVYDDATGPEAIADLLPTAGPRVLITSRSPHWSGSAEVLRLDVLPIEDAVAVLESATARDDQAGARTIAEALGCLPLALDVAAATCRYSQMRFADYAAQISRTIAGVPGDASHRGVAAVFELAVAAAATRRPPAEALMAFLAHCAPERIPIMLAEGAIEDAAEFTAALAALVDLSLAAHDSFEDGTPALIIPLLVQELARERSNANGLAHDAIVRIIARLATIYPEDGFGNPQSWSLCAKLTPHLLALRAGDPGGSSIGAGWPDLLDRAGSYLHGRACDAEAAPLLRDALALGEKTLGPDHPDTAAILNNLARLLRDQGDLAGARRLYERALAIHDLIRGHDHPDTAGDLDNLAAVLQDQGDFAAARPLCERALAIREKTLGRDHPDAAGNLNNLAGLLAEQGDFAGARPLFERALAIHERALGPDHRDTATTLTNLALLMVEQGDLAGAWPLLQRSLAIRKQVLGPDHPDTAGSLNNLALVLEAQGDHAGARSLFESAQAVYEEALGAEHPNTNRVRCHRARLLLAAGIASEALALGESALAAHEKVLGRDHPWTADSARFIAEARQALDRGAHAAASSGRSDLGRRA
jgi:tetratricopeptide (TPR) repeat protein